MFLRRGNLIDSDFLKDSQEERKKSEESVSLSDSHDISAEEENTEDEPSYLKSFLLFNRSTIVKRNSLSVIQERDDS